MMASRRREVLQAQAPTDRENLHSQQTRVHPAKAAPPTRRPVLDEISNKLGIVGKAKPTESKPNAKELAKPTVFKSIRPPAARTKENDVKSYSARQIESFVDPDESTRNELTAVSDYVKDIYKYHLELEAKFPIRRNFLTDHQTTPKMRAILLNWIVEVHVNFKTTLETLYLCVQIIDRYLQENHKISKVNLQLVGAAALLIACKYEEIYVQDLDDFVYVCDYTFCKRQILAMEWDILRKLNCDLGKPTPIVFLRRFSKIAQVPLEQYNLAKYILELSIIEYDLAHVKPSLQAAAACCLAISILTKKMLPQLIWSPMLQHYTTYKFDDFKLVLFSMAKVLNNLSKYHTTIKDKYADSKFSKISANVDIETYLKKIVAK